jgi:hypothetical protein
MSGFGKSEGGKKPPVREALSRIEAALHAALCGNGRARADLARQALRGDAADRDPHIEAWLEAVASELQSGAGVLVPEDMVEAIAERMMADPLRSMRAHANIEGKNLQNLIRRR